MTDPAIHILAATATAGSFEEFFGREYERLSRAMYLLTTDHARAEDLAQEAMARTYERWERVGAMASPTAYVYRGAINLCRRRSRRRREQEMPADSPRSGDPATVAADRDAVIRALARVSASQREALVLVSWLGYD